MINSPIKEISRPNVVLRYLLLGLLVKILLGKETLLVIKIIAPRFRQLVQLGFILRIR